VKQTIAEYAMISSEDRILVAVSGGKDSTVLLYLLKTFGYDVEAVTVDAHIGCYSEENVKNIKQVCKDLGVKLHVAPFRKNYGNSVCYITEVVQSKGYPFGTCTVCGVLRRRLLNKAGRDFNATKIALGHNMDDEVQAFLMNCFRNRQSLNARLGPVPGVISDPSLIQRIKPLFFLSEEDITYYSQAKGFPVQYGDCPCAEKSFRYAIKNFIKESKKEFPDMKKNILSFMLAILPKLRKRVQSNIRPKTCTLCDEPSSSETCRSCDILLKFKQAP